MDFVDEEPCRVLVVEDDVTIQKALTRALGRLGYEVELATDGAQGLERALAAPPHVILTDIRMPELDGHTFLRRLASHDVDSAVVVMSAHGQMADVIEVMRQGAIDYLSKPWTPSELAAALARAAEIHRKRRDGRGASRAPAVSAGGTSPPTGGAGGDAVFGAVLEKLRAGEIVLPALSPVVEELRVIVADPVATADEVARVIERDPRTAAQVLRLASSAQYARHGRSLDVRAAVQRVGLAHIRSIAETLHAHACFAVKDARLAALHQRVWRHSVARAVSMRALAELSQGAETLDPELAYGAGLFVDAGASFLLWLAGERRAAPAEVASLPAAIAAQHAEVGSLLLERWNLHPTLAFVAAHHHDPSPPAPSSPYWPVSVLAAELADGLVGTDDVTRGAPVDGNLVDRCAAELGIGATLLGRMRVRLVPELEAIFESVG